MHQVRAVAGEHLLQRLLLAGEDPEIRRAAMLGHVLRRRARYVIAAPGEERQVAGGARARRHQRHHREAEADRGQSAIEIAARQFAVPQSGNGFLAHRRLPCVAFCLDRFLEVVAR
jgi:hypothetical protein